MLMVLRRTVPRLAVNRVSKKAAAMLKVRLSLFSSSFVCVSKILCPHELLNTSNGIQKNFNLMEKAIYPEG